jgi:hypothetical protein
VGVRQESGAVVVLHEQCASATRPSQEKCHVSAGIGSSPGAFGNEQQENVLLHANVVRHM